MTYTKEQVLAIIDRDQGYLEEADGIDSEDVEKFNSLIDIRNELRAEQRKRLENMKPKKTRDVITNC